MQKQVVKHISITNDKVESMLRASSNASMLVEEALLYLDYNIRSQIMTERERDRLIQKKLIREEFYG